MTVWLRCIFSHRGQLRDSYTTITEDSNAHWCPRRRNHALRPGAWKLLNLKIRVNLTYFVFWETCNYLLQPLKSSTKWKKIWYLVKIRNMYKSPFGSKVFKPLGIELMTLATSTLFFELLWMAVWISVYVPVASMLFGNVFVSHHAFLCQCLPVHFTHVAV